MSIDSRGPVSDIVVSNGRVYHLGVGPGQVAPRLFLVGDPARAFKVAAHFDSLEHDVRHREFVTLTGPYQGRPMTVIGTGIGTDNFEIALLEAWAARSLDLDTRLPLEDVEPVTAIRVGTSGGVQPEVPAGTLCISTRALGFDGSGPFFDVPLADEQSGLWEEAAAQAVAAATPRGRRFGGALRPYAATASPEVVAALAGQAGRLGFPFAPGVTVTVSAFYGAGRYLEGLVSTVPAFKDCFLDLQINGERVLNFEMESSLLFHLATGLGWRAGTICPVIGVPGRQGGVVDFEAVVEKAITVALAAMLELAP